MRNGLLEKGYRTVKAQYHDEIDEYAGNPFIEALPPMKEDIRERFASIAMVPKFSAEDKSRSITRRKSKLMHWTDNICIPLMWHDDVAESLEIMIRNPYIGWSRDDFAERQIEMNEQLKRKFGKTGGNTEEKGLVKVDFFKPSQCFFLAGLPGVGKSTVVNRILADYPTCIDHSEADWCRGEVKQIPYIRITCPPPQGYRKALYSRILTELDLSLGVEPKSYGNKKIDELQQMTRLRLSNHFVGVVVLEEFTNILRGNSDTVDAFITDFFNTIPCSALLVGGISNVNLFAKEAFTVRRAVKAGEQDRYNHKSDDPDWNRFCCNVWKSMRITRTCTPYTDEIHSLMSSLTQGFPFLFVELLVDAQILAMKEAEENGTPEVIKPEHLITASKTTKRRIAEKVSVVENATASEVLNAPDLFTGKIVKVDEKGKRSVADKDQLDKNAKVREIVEQYKLLKFDKLYCPVSELRKIATEYCEQCGSKQTTKDMLKGAVRFFEERMGEFNSSLPEMEVDESDLDDFVV